MESDWLTPHLDRLAEVAGRFMRHFHARAETAGCLPASQFFVLKHLGRIERCTVSELAQQMGTSVAGATGLLDRLVKAGLVRRQRDRADRRVIRISVTPAGTAALEQDRLRRRAVLAELMAALEPDEVRQLVAIYEKLNRAVPFASDCPTVSPKGVDHP